MKSIIQYKKLIPEWENAQTQEMLQSARKNYPSVQTLDEVIEKSSGSQLREIPFLIMHGFAMIATFLSKDAKRKFRPKTIREFVSPEILSFDAATRSRRREPWPTIRRSHQHAVQLALTVEVWRKALNQIIQTETYGRELLRVIFFNDSDALFNLGSMLNKKAQETFPYRVTEFKQAQASRIKEISRAERGEPEGRGSTIGKGHEINSVLNQTLANRIHRSRESTPNLADFLPDELTDQIRREMTTILSRISESSVEDAKLFSDALNGVFRCLPKEYVADLKNVSEKDRSDGRIPSDKLVPLNKPTNQDEADDESEISRLEAEKKYAGLNASPLDELGKLLNEVIASDILHQLEDKLIQLKNQKPEVVDLYFVLKQGITNDIEIGARLGCHRNTVRNRKAELKKMLLNILPKE